MLCYDTESDVNGFNAMILILYNLYQMYNVLLCNCFLSLGNQMNYALCILKVAQSFKADTALAVAL